MRTWWSGGHSLGGCMVAGMLGRELRGFTRCACGVVVACVAAVVLAMGIPVSSSAAVFAPTAAPYMGWNPYYAKLGGSNEATFESVAESLISTGLQQAGYKIFWLDFGWASGRDSSNGNLIISPTQWP